MQMLGGNHSENHFYRNCTWIYIGLKHEIRTFYDTLCRQITIHCRYPISVWCKPDSSFSEITNRETLKPKWSSRVAKILTKLSFILWVINLRQNKLAVWKVIGNHTRSLFSLKKHRTQESKRLLTARNLNGFPRLFFCVKFPLGAAACVLQEAVRLTYPSERGEQPAKQSKMRRDPFI